MKINRYLLQTNIRERVLDQEDIKWQDKISDIKQVLSRSNPTANFKRIILFEMVEANKPKKTSNGASPADG